MQTNNNMVFYITSLMSCLPIGENQIADVLSEQTDYCLSNVFHRHGREKWHTLVSAPYIPVVCRQVVIFLTKV